MLKEFRDFVMRGNVLDLAVAVIIGAAFGAVVNSLVNDVIMPPIGKLLGNIDFSNLFINLTPEKAVASVAQAKEVGAATINYGVFINTLITFLIVAFVVFLIVRTANQMKKPVAATTKACPYCKSQVALDASRCAFCTSDLTAQVRRT